MQRRAEAAGYGLGLGKYSEMFAANDVDFRVLPDLNSTDLQELGVSLGHRKIMLAAIAALREAKPQKPELQTKQEQPTGVAVDTRLGPSTAEAVSEPGPDVRLGRSLECSYSEDAFRLKRCARPRAENDAG